MMHTGKLKEGVAVMLRWYLRPNAVIRAALANPQTSMRQVAAALLFFGPKKIILVQSAEHGRWGLPKGGIERRINNRVESLGRAVRREVREETGLTSGDWNLREYICSFDCATSKPRGFGLWSKEFHVIKGLVLRDPVGFQSSEISEVRAISLDRLSELSELEMRPERRLVIMKMLSLCT